MKKIVIGLLLLILCVGAVLVFLNREPTFPDQKDLSSPPEATPLIEEIEPIQFTPEELEKYSEVYENPYVLHIRKALNGYLEGTNEGMELPETVIEAHEYEGTSAGLDSFSKDYYKSKFIVYAINDSITGGKMVNIIFQDKPDKLFNVWVYKLAGDTYDLRGFWQNENFDEEKMNEIQKLYENYLNDPERAL